MESHAVMSHKQRCLQISLPESPQALIVIDLCINNAIIGVQEQNTYAQTEG
jgi:hypothetical protein